MGLGPRPGGGGNPYRGEHGLGSLAIALIVGHGAAVGQQEIDPFGTIHGTATAQSDNKIDGILVGKFGRLADEAAVGVFPNFGEKEDLQTTLPEQTHRPRGMARGNDTGIRYKHDPAAGKLSNQHPNL